MAFAIGLFMLITLSSVYDTVQRGLLTAFDGELSVLAGSRSAVLHFNGGGRSGACSLPLCLRHRTLLNGKRGTVLLDERGQIHEVTVNSQPFLSRKDIEEYRDSLLFQTALAFPFFVACLLVARALRPDPDSRVKRS